MALRKTKSKARDQHIDATNYEWYIKFYIKLCNKLHCIDAIEMSYTSYYLFNYK